LLPFVQGTPEDIADQAQKFTGSTIIAWSTGAHILLSRLDEIKNKNIFLLAPFLDFTSFTPEWVLNRMIQALKVDMHKVVAKFWQKCGITNYRSLINDHRSMINDHRPLINGLKFLSSSKIKLKISGLKSKLFIIHGQEDKIVPFSATEQLCSLLPEAELIMLSTGHYISEENIKQIIYAKTDTKIF